MTAASPAAMRHEPWYPGIAVDHLYATCPGLLRTMGGDEPLPGPGAINPEAGDVCGMCLRTWRARTPGAAPLSDSEREALLLAASGLTNPAAARRLGMKHDVYKARLRSVLCKVRARNTTHAVVLALKAGLIQLDDIDTPKETRL